MEAVILDGEQGEMLRKGFRDLADQLLEQLHNIDKHLNFWQRRAQGTERDKVRFMVLERGPVAFVEGLKHLVRSFFLDSERRVCAAATRMIDKRVALFSTLRQILATLIGLLYIAVGKIGEADHRHQRRIVSECIISVLIVLARMEGTYDLPQSDYQSRGDVVQSQPIILKFDSMSEGLMRGMDWTKNELQAALEMLSGNVWKLKEFLAVLVTRCRKPRRLTRHWIHYSVGAVGLAVASGWVVQHSRLGGSDDLDRWMNQSRQDMYTFLDEHVNQPLFFIRQNLFDTFRKRHHGAAELIDLKLTSETLHRMVKEFVAQTVGTGVASTASQQELMEILAGRYEEILTQPVKTLLGGELAMAFLIQPCRVSSGKLVSAGTRNGSQGKNRYIRRCCSVGAYLSQQVQKLKLDIETALLDLNQIGRANVINLAIHAALLSSIVPITLGVLLREPFNQIGAERRRRAQTKWRMLMVELDRADMAYQISKKENQGKILSTDLGLLVYRFYRLRKAATKSSGEWRSLQKDILDLTRARLPKDRPIDYNLAYIVTRMERLTGTHAQA